MTSIVESKNNWDNNMRYLIPGMIQYARAYVIKYHANLLNEIKALTEIFDRVITIRLDESSFSLLNTMILSFPYEALKPYYPGIFNKILTRLHADKQSNKQSMQFSRGLVYSLSLFININGIPELINSLEQIQPGIFMMVIKSESDKIEKVDGINRRREVLLGFTKLIIGIEGIPTDTLNNIISGLARLVELGVRRNFGPEEEELGDDNMQRMKYQQLFNATVNVNIKLNFRNRKTSV